MHILFYHNFTNKNEVLHSNTSVKCNIGRIITLCYPTVFRNIIYGYIDAIILCVLLVNVPMLI